MTPPNDLPEPPDHEERMRYARAVAQWHLGDPSWASTIITAYMTPTVADAEAIEEIFGEDDE